MKKRSIISMILIFVLLIAFTRGTLEKTSQSSTLKPIASWNFNNISKNTVPDTSGHNLTGTLANTSTVPGISGSAVFFNGHDSYMEVQDSPVLHMENFSIIMWINTNFSNSIGLLIGMGYNSNHTFGLYMTSYNNILGLELNFFSNGTYGNNFGINPGHLSISTNNWHQIAFGPSTIDNNSIDFYIDGQYLTSSQFPSDQSLGSIFGPVFFGSESSSLGFNYSFIGAMDDVSIFNQSLNANYIAQNYQTEESLISSSSQYTIPSSQTATSGFSLLNFIHNILVNLPYIIFFGVIVISVVFVFLFVIDKRKNN